MSEEVLYIVDQESSPRSTIIGVGAASGGRLMTTAVLSGIMNDAVGGSDAVSTPEGKLLSSSSKSGNHNKDVSSLSRNDESKSTNIAPEKGIGSTPLRTTNKSGGGVEKESRDGSPPTPISSHDYGSRLHYSNHTPQQGSGYFVGYAQPHQQHMIPEPESPAPHSSAGYSVSFFQPGPDFSIPSSGNSYVGVSNASLSPLRGVTPTVAVMGTIPPPSPLFPRVSSGGGLDGQNGALRAPPSLPYMTSLQLGSSSGSNYQSYPSAGVASHSSDDGNWNGSGVSRNQQNNFSSPQMGALGMQMLYSMPMTRATSGGRAYSFDETMLPPAVLDDPATNPAYSPYGGGAGGGVGGANQNSPGLGGGTLFAHPPSWGYGGGGPPDPYSNAPSSPLQPRPTMTHHMGYPPSPTGTMRGAAAAAAAAAMSPYGQFHFPASSPGPPIQTTSCNKGPDGANLFIFHIPNHFTNMDMYQLFTPYGNLLSVRIMVERDTGRSRGFGFVSYDSPEAAAMAIKELNGFPIGNKRLKVQHKQIRRQDMQDQDSISDGFGGGGSNYPRFPSLPPSGANASAGHQQPLWFEGGTQDDEGHLDDDEDDEAHLQHHLQEHDDVIGDDDDNDGVNHHTAAVHGSPTSSPPIRLEIGTNNHPASATENEEDDVSPLATLGQLQSALPDISGNVTPE